MQAFLLNFTRIVEKNPKTYASIIGGLVLCLSLFIVEAVHIQKVVEALGTTDQAVLRATIEPLSERYTWSRILILVVAFIWSSVEYSQTKKALGL